MKKPIISILSTLAGAALGAGAVGKVSLDKTKKVQSMSEWKNQLKRTGICQISIWRYFL